MLESLPLFGREQALAALTRAVEIHPWVTVWGPPGVGKTSLARALAPDAWLRVTDDTAFWVSLAHGLGVEAGTAAPELAVTRAMAGLGCVVIDDGDRAAASLRHWLPTLTGHARVVVVASRPLGGDGEHDIELSPLDTDAAAALWQEVTGRLGHRSTLAMGREVAARLDGLPLALMWFAGRAALMGDDESLQWLRRRGGHTAPPSAALEHALEGLTSQERAALSAAATFEGGFPTRDVAAWNVELETIEELVRRGLVRIERTGSTPRALPYWLVRERVRGQLREEGRWAALCRRHAEHVVDRLGAVGIDDALDIGALADARAELDAIVDREHATGPDLALRAATLLAALAPDDGAARATVSTLDELSSKVALVPEATRLAAARLERRLGRVAAARARLDGLGGFEAQLERAHLDRMQGAPHVALASYEAARAIAAGDPRQECIATGELGRMQQSLGHYRAAQRLHEGAIAIQAAQGWVRREALERSLHARATHREGRVAEAVGLHERAIDLHRRLGRRRLEGAEIGHLGYCLHELGEHDRAETCLRTSVEMLGRVGDVVMESIERLMLARLLADTDRLSEAQLELAIVERAAKAMSMPRLEATHHLIAGFVALGRDERDGAAQHWRAGAALGPQLEVGFEALLPLHLAWLDREADVPLASALARVTAVESSGLALAGALWAAAARGQPQPEVPIEIAAASSDVRRAQRFIGGASPRLTVAADGQTFVWAGSTVSLGRRAAPRRLLASLVAQRLSCPGAVVGFDDLVEAGWPNERMGFEAARKRLRTAIWTLRKLGLGEVLLTREDGYLLDPRVDAAIDPG